MRSDDIPKISVTIITYNQENIIGRALDSVLIQKEWVYEIIVCDDCSTDNNWNVILEYANKYPDLIKPFKNEHNLGIFGNIESTWDKPTGDAVIFLSGDDELCDGLFENAIKLIDENKIDYKNELFCLYFDYKVVYPTRKMNFLGSLLGNKPSNKFVTKGFDPISLKVRGLIVNRTVIYSINIQNKFTPVPKDMGIFADGLIDIQLQQYAAKSYYSPFIGSVYYAKIGISIKTEPKDSYYSRYLLSEAYKKMFDLSKKDIAWLEYINTRNDFFLKPSIKQLMLTMKYNFKSIEMKYGIKGLQLRMFMVDILTFFKNTISKNK